MSLPAVVLADAESADLQVATLSVLERLVVGLHRAGCAPITVVADRPLPPMPRARALAVPWRRADRACAVDGACLLASGNVLVHADDLGRVASRKGRLTDGHRTPLDVGVVDGWDGVTPVAEALAALTPVPARRTAARLTSEDDAVSVTRRFWKSLKSSTDSLLDRTINRPLGRPLSKLLIRTPVTPNQISIAAMISGLAGAWCFARGTYASGICGALLFQLAAVIDCVDGDVAVAVFKETPLGKWLDISADQVVHVAIFVALAVGAARAGSRAPVAVLSASTVAGALISFAVVVRGMLQPPERKNATLARMIDAVTNRDFSYILLAMAVLGKLELFLWFSAFGVHAFWIAALAVQRMGRTGDAVVEPSA